MTEIQLLQEIRDLLKANSHAKTVLNTEEAAEYIGISRSKLWELKQLYQVPFVQIADRILYRKKDLDDWLEARSVKTPKDALRLSDGRRKHCGSGPGVADRG